LKVRLYYLHIIAEINHSTKPTVVMVFTAATSADIVLRSQKEKLYFPHRRRLHAKVQYLWEI